jgi:hypothetical protein
MGNKFTLSKQNTDIFYNGSIFNHQGGNIWAVHFLFKYP